LSLYCIYFFFCIFLDFIPVCLYPLWVHLVVSVPWVLFKSIFSWNSLICFCMSSLNSLNYFYCLSFGLRN
jgi:hypothetical protein